MNHARCLLLAGLLAALSVAPALAGDHGDLRQRVESGEILPLATLLERLPLAHDGRLLEAELEEEHGRPIYEIEWLAPDGTVHEYAVDARDGRLLDVVREQEHGKERD